MSYVCGTKANLLEQCEFSVGQAHLIHESGHFTVDGHIPLDVGPWLTYSEGLVRSPPPQL